MKKSAGFFTLSLLIFNFFACDLVIPDAVQIKGTPEIRFGADFDIGTLLTETIDSLLNEYTNDNENNNEKLKLINCTNTELKTFIIYSEVLNQSLAGLLDSLAPIINHFGEYETPSDIPLIDDGQVEPVNIPSVDLSSFFYGFSLTGYQVNMYMSGSEIVDILTVDMNINGSVITREGIYTSGLGGSLYTYDGTSFPEGLPLDIIFDGSAMSISPKVYIKEGSIITASMIKNPKVLIEFAIWLPLILKANEDETIFDFPEDFFPDTDLFGRDNADDVNPIGEYVESLRLEIVLSGRRPFSNAILIVRSAPEGLPEVYIETPFSGNALIFEINESKMEEINNTLFIPQISMRFYKDGTISIPRNFRATEFAFKAKVNYKMELQEEPK
ncbi:MAG: hypothetical protein FWC06_06520 [Treponema sp.]|nr:hypothetical protein [Treponema sp.]